MATELSQEAVFNKIIKKEKLVRHQVSSFDRFVENLPMLARQLRTISAAMPDGSRIELQMEDLRLASSSGSSGNPRSPEAALQERATWRAPLHCEISLKHYEPEKKKGEILCDETKIIEKIGFCPIIVRPKDSSVDSLGCPFDLGGYFIVDGMEKVGIPIERSWQKNSIQVEIHTNYVQASVLSWPRKTQMGEISLTRKITIKSYNEDGNLKIVAIIGNLDEKGNKEIPLSILFCALGLSSIPMIAGAIQVPTVDSISVNSATISSSPSVWETENQNLVFRFENILQFMSEELESELQIDRKSEGKVRVVKSQKADGKLMQREAIKWISKHLPNRGDERDISNLLKNEMLSNVGRGFSSLWPKALVLGSMVKRVVLCSAGLLKETDRHSLAHKSLLLIGDLLLEEISRSLLSWWKSIEKKLETELSRSKWKGSSAISTRVSNVINASKGPLASFSRCFKTGQIGGNSRWSHNGVIAPLNRQNYMCTVSQLRQVTSPVHEQSRAIDWRKTHSSHCGRYCPVETPDNQRIGLQKQLSLGAKVSCDDSEPRIIDHKKKGNSGTNLSGKGSSSKQTKTEGRKRQKQRSGKASSSGKVQNGEDNDMVDGEIATDSTSDTESDSESDPDYDDDNDLESGEDVDMVHIEIDSDSDSASDSGSQDGDEVDISFMDKKFLIKELSEGHWEGGEYYGASRVYLNGRILGCHEDGEQLAKCLREARMQGKIRKEVGIVWDTVVNEVRVTTSIGRILRPLFCVQFNCHGARLSALEFLDAEEEKNTRVASNMEDLRPGEHTHVEVHPSLSLGAIASTIPWFHHNAVTRNHYGTLMGKQAMGLSGTNFMERWDKTSHVLHYPQKPLIVTKSSRNLGFLDLPNGQNTIVAICPYEGYNQEDAIVFNKSAIEYGMFHSSTYKTYEAKEGKKVEIKKYGESPAFDKLDPDGLPIVGERLNKTKRERENEGRNPNCREEMVVIDKVRTDIGQCNAVRVRHSEAGQVAKVAVNAGTGEEPSPKAVAVQVRSMRRPVPGDKFTSRHGQKGVVACMTSREDLPFSREGICPDVIISPHAIPARATPGQLLESLAAKAKSQLEDASAFGTTDKIKSIEDTLLRSGYSPKGEERLYCGKTGKPLPALLFMGPVFYQRLPHLAKDKINARGRGPRELFTGQVCKGKSKGGGYRIGDMEVAAIAAHGAANFLHSRTTKLADPYDIFVCKGCKLSAKKYFDNPRRKEFSLTCPRCRSSDKIIKTQIPFGVYAIQQELMCMNIFMSLDVTDVMEGTSL